MRHLLLPKPTEKLIDNYLNVFEHDERYSYADNAIKKLVEKFPFNNDLESIILKISTINDLYSTNIFSTFNLAKHIFTQGFDCAINSKDYSIVNRIALGHGIKSSKTNKEFNFYSFATKYCSWHDQNSFPLFDKNILLTLSLYNKQYQYNVNNDFKNYNNLVKTIQVFIKEHKLEMYSLKEIDKFLWYLGKDYFNKKKK